MENPETIILVAGSLAVACAFGWTATCKLMLLVASGSKKTNGSGRPAISRIGHPLPAVLTPGRPDGFDDIGVPRDDRRKAGLRVGSAIVIDLREWKDAAAARVRFENSRRPIGVRSPSPAQDAARASSGGPNNTHR